MKSNRRLKLALMCLLPLTLTSCKFRSFDVDEGAGGNSTPSEPSGGQTDQDVYDKLYVDNGSPVSSKGENGDMYINLDTGDYYMLTSNGWDLAGNVNEESGNGHEGATICVYVKEGAPTDDFGKVGDFWVDESIEGDLYDIIYYVKTSNGWVNKGNILPYFERKQPITFWSSFGPAYTAPLDNIINGIKSEAEIDISHQPQGSYDEVFRNMQSALAVGDYPNVVTGYPDHIVSYLGSGIINPIDDYLESSDIDDYYPGYLVENMFYDNKKPNAENRLFGLPFYKSTELMAYNGVFVDYCATLDLSLASIPTTWDEWEVQGPKYDAIYQSLFGKCLFGVQDVYGNASNFYLLDYAGGTLPGTYDEYGNLIYNGRKLLLDLRNVDYSNSILLSCDSTDSAFITLVKQWDAEYTYMDPAEYVKIVKRRTGSVLFNSSENKPKVIEMLKFFNKLNKSHIFGTPVSMNGSFTSTGYERCQTMFMICTSGGMSYNTTNWNHRIRFAPIPYKDISHKYVMTMGADICMTDQGEFEDSVKLIRALTSGKYQTQWCLQTGYYPTSKSAVNSNEYQQFLHEDEIMPVSEAYTSPTRVAYREGLKLNANTYMDSSKGWIQFVDVPFVGSYQLRSVIKGVLDAAIRIANVDDNDAYASVLNNVEQTPTIKGLATVNFIH